MAAQQGALTVCYNLLLDHDVGIGSVVEEALEDNDNIAVTRKYVIAQEAKKDFCIRLHNMNVTAAGLFPGIDGLGKELWELMRLG